jgi:hypothetical protein
LLRCGRVHDLATEELPVEAHRRGETLAGPITFFVGFLLYMVLSETLDPDQAHRAYTVLSAAAPARGGAAPATFRRSAARDREDESEDDQDAEHPDHDQQAGSAVISPHAGRLRPLLTFQM